MRFERRTWVTLALLALSAPLCLGALGPRGLIPYVTVWTLALPRLLPALRATWKAELPGALFLFWTAAFVDNLDDLFGAEQVTPLGLVALSFVYLVMRHRDTRSLWRAPVAVCLAVFYAQQVASAYGFAVDGVLHVVENRISLVAALLVAAVMVRRSNEGRQLVLWLVILGALVSVPVMACEVARPELRLFSFAATVGPLRAGGLYGQANGAGIALDMGIAALLALRVGGDVSRRTAACVGGLFLVGLVACASRGALFITLILLATYAWAAARRVAGRAPVATALLMAGVVLFALPSLARAVVAEDRRLEAAGFEGVDRLNELVLALSGKTTDLEEDDSGHLNVAIASAHLGAERPWLGFGTDNFTVRLREREVGAHVQFLQIFGENGVVGLVAYAALLVAVALAIARVQPRFANGAFFIVGAWLVMHFESHNLHTARFTMVPLAYLCGLPALTIPVAAAAARRAAR